MSTSAKLSSLNRTITVLFLFFFTSLHLSAQVRGKVVDKISNEPLIGATIATLDNKSSTFSGLDGSFDLKKVPKGNNILLCKALGYDTKTITITISNDKVTILFDMEVTMNQLNRVTIESHSNTESAKYAIAREKKAENIINVVSAEAIKLLPDITTAGVLQRVSGVALEKSSTGDARYAIIRGMDQRYNYTLVNGIKIPSPDNKYRYVPMDMFPADLLERLEVIKALTPEMEGDAIGGVMNLVLKNAPRKLEISANVATGFSQLLADNGYTNFDKNTVNPKSPAEINGTNYIASPDDFTYKNFDYTKKQTPINTIMGFSAGNRFLKNKKLGVVVAASYQNLATGSKSIWFKPENQPQPGNIPSFNDFYSRQYNTSQTRYGVHNKIDYVINKLHKISLYNVYLKLDETQYRHTIDTSFSIGRSGVGTGNTYILNRSRIQNQSIYNSTLQGDNQLTNQLKLNWSLVYSKAKSATPDWSEYQTVHVVGHDSDGNPTATPEVLNVPFYRIWTKNTDRDYAGYLNFILEKPFFGKQTTYKFGGLYRDKLRSNNYYEYNLIPKTSSTGQPIPFDGTLTPDKFQFNGTTAAQGAAQNPLTYTATEKIFAPYAQMNIMVNSNLSILGGVRFEATQQGWQTVLDPTVTYGAKGNIKYNDILPSIHFKYSLSKKENLRASYFSAINRPGFFEYIPFRINDDNFALSGNPKLKHATSSNFDFRYEFFPKKLDQLLIGAFYKTITNPIETSIEFTGTSSATLKPLNFGTAINYGIEAAYTHYWGYIGVSGNYTYTHSAITTSKLYYNESFIAVQTTQTRPLQGQSPHIANLSLLYKNQNNGLDIQIASVYTGEKITFVSPYKDLDYWQKSRIQLDFSFEKKFTKNLSVYGKVNNLLNAVTLVEIRQPNIYRSGKFALPEQTKNDRITVQKDLYGQNYLLGLKYKF
ncbi:TonB-dependent receptor [Flavobacterium sp. 7A]|uniref:TonB-dependent receptor n=1 Tax=Flavobacterium sp. 7A TaxID=2940571 RepID=UPI0022266574|nr:TonB-dependent receptor [Flavobacterium sp. 7A]MCW2119252.1 TonB-dependent receptor [Flavobacterium sp. 7A]